MRYNNYHKHTHESNIRTPDSIVFPEHYMQRAKELNHTTYFTTEHGSSGNIWGVYDLCKKYDLKCIYGAEAYYVDDRFSKESKQNFHIVLIAKNSTGMKDINRIISLANTEGFHYKPRIDLELLLSLNPENVYVTTACVLGRLSGNNAEEMFLKPLLKHFGSHLFLEVQSHNHPSQISYNKKILELSKKYDIEIIHGNDSHYIFPEDAIWRDKYLKGKGIYYDEEVGFELDYPSCNEVILRYKKQGVLSVPQMISALNNTLIFDECEDLNLNKDIKMPSIFKEKVTPEQKNKEFEKILEKRFGKILKDDTSNEILSKSEEYLNAIRFEADIVKDTNMSDYFILNEKIIDRAVNKYGGVITPTGRGSGVSFYINKILGFTNIDRIASPVPLYPTRFMSKTRILQTRSLPDIDFNLTTPEPFIKASKDILGDDNVYYMVAYGTFKDSGAFRNMCRSVKYDMQKQLDELLFKRKSLEESSSEFKKVNEQIVELTKNIEKFGNEYNEVGKNLDAYKNKDEWKQIIEDSKRFIGVIDSISPSPCSFLLLNEPISEEIGLIRIGDEICCCIDGYNADVWKFLKNDFLTVKVLTIISETFESINKPLMPVNELLNCLDGKVWRMYELGLTATLNQVDSEFATPLIMRYKPKNVAEMTAFVASIRPAFASLRDSFIDRKKYSTGIKEIDELLKESYCYILYQESIMKILNWCGIKEDETYGIIKKIAKKKFKENELEELKGTLRGGFINQTGSDDKFDDIWQVIEDSASYAFNASHALSVAIDSLYGAYLKSHYPLHYYSVILNNYDDDTKETEKIVSELDYFDIQLKPIQFRFSKGSYFFDVNSNSIFKGLKSIKFLNNTIAEELFQLKDNHYEDFIQLLVDISENTSCNSKQLEILTSLNFFKEFGGNKYLLKLVDFFIKKYKKTYTAKTKEKRLALIYEYCETLDKNEIFNPKEQIEVEFTYLGHSNTTLPELDYEYSLVVDISKKYTHPMVTLYHLKTGDMEVIKCKNKYYTNNKFQKFDMIKVVKRTQENKWLKTSSGFVMLDEKEPILQVWNIVK